MAEALIILATLALVAAIVLSAPVHLSVRYGREGKADRLRVDLSLWKFNICRYSVDMLDIDATLRRAALIYRPGLQRDGGRVLSGKRKKAALPVTVNAFRRLLQWADVLSLAGPYLEYISRRTTISHLAWKTVFGLGDPFRTGMATGLIWSLKVCAVSLLLRRTKTLKLPALAVVPDFSKPCLTVNLDCRLGARAAHVVYAGLGLLVKLLIGGGLFRIIELCRRGKIRETRP